MFHRITDTDRNEINISIDGIIYKVFEGDTLMTAILVNYKKLSNGEYDEGNRAGLCFMGACQDCWVKTSDGEYLQACTTFVEEGISIIIENK